MKRRYFVIDIEKCIGCFNCLHACKDEHVGNDWSPLTLPQMLHNEYWLTVTEHVRGQHPMVDVAYLPEPCNHCEQASCIEQGRGAIYRRADGIVIIDPAKAKGAGDLSASCPYGRISYNPDEEVSQKCTFCAHLLDAGWQQPRCVQACPLDALQTRYCEPEEMAEEVQRENLSCLPHTGLSQAATPSTYFKNLHRVNALFLGGSVAGQEDAREICLAGCSVALMRDDKEILRQETNDYGEFKFDGLPTGSYTIRLDTEGFDPLESAVDLIESLYVGLVRPRKTVRPQGMLEQPPE